MLCPHVQFSNTHENYKDTYFYSTFLLGRIYFMEILKHIKNGHMYKLLIAILFVIGKIVKSKCPSIDIHKRRKKRREGNRRRRKRARKRKHKCVYMCILNGFQMFH